ncbi:hypothetical protein HELRODRAFT_180815 [Helobdella robusta]|uniref:Uncharacterized protein n=1 Tax=Helobdella robusta TaxID=6412 RepID=T1FGB4_HELRO|nr:hypothetical protein HELRODRAFT_180815 [Helobdella robusta]ESN93498.1 hypothetical protein HELRODRAFT_180815 [Helobdella robusta]
MNKIVLSCLVVAALAEIGFSATSSSTSTATSATTTTVSAAASTTRAAGGTTVSGTVTGAMQAVTTTQATTTPQKILPNGTQGLFMTLPDLLDGPDLLDDNHGL